MAREILEGGVATKADVAVTPLLPLGSMVIPCEQRSYVLCQRLTLNASSSLFAPNSNSTIYSRNYVHNANWNGRNRKSGIRFHGVNL